MTDPKQLLVALRHVGKMCVAMDHLAHALVPGRKKGGPDPERAGEALVALLTARRDYDRVIEQIARET